MLIPTVPSFTANEANVTHLQQLSNAVQFLAVAGNFPLLRAIKTATLALTAGAWNTIPMTTIEVDTDNMANAANGGVQINTQGYYRFEACIEVQPPAANDGITLAFLYTVGPNNPNFSNGTSVRFGGEGTSFANTASVDWAFCEADICPIVLYPNDTVVVQAFPAGAVTTHTLTNASATQGWFSCQMSAMWIRTGS